MIVVYIKKKADHGTYEYDSGSINMIIIKIVVQKLFLLACCVPVARQPQIPAKSIFRTGAVVAMSRLL